MSRLVLRGLLALLTVGLTTGLGTTGALADTKIVGGTPAAPNEFRAMAQLHLRGGTDWRTSHVCGGVLVDRRWVATAAHCLVGLVPSQVEVVLGEHRLSTAEGKEAARTVASFHRHPEFNYSTAANDIALLYLSSDAPVAPATIESAEIAGAPAAGAPVTAAGWGLTRPPSAIPPGQPRSSYLSDVLLEAGLTMTDAQTCRDAIAGLGLRHSGQICAGSPTGSTCNGDSGGPLMRWTDGRWAAIGLTSFGPGDCAGQTAYTRLATYSTWITSWKIYKANPGSLDMRCYPIGSVTGCSLDGPLGSMYPLSITFTAGGGTRVVYPSAGSFPYTSNNGVIYFGVPSGSTYGRCPSGTPVTMSVSFDGQHIGSVTRSCP